MNLVSPEFKFTGDIISGCSIKVMAIKAVIDLGDQLFHPKREIER